VKGEYALKQNTEEMALAARLGLTANQGVTVSGEINRNLLGSFNDEEDAPLSPAAKPETALGDINNISGPAISGAGETLPNLQDEDLPTTAAVGTLSNSTIESKISGTIPRPDTALAQSPADEKTLPEELPFAPGTPWLKPEVLARSFATKAYNQMLEIASNLGENVASEA
jgi:hypothetical protein